VFLAFLIPHTLTLAGFYSKQATPNPDCNYWNINLYYNDETWLLKYSDCELPPPPTHHTPTHPTRTHTHTHTDIKAMDPATNVVSAKPLNHDAVFRIEVSLSSRKSSAIVMRTTARLYSLEGTQQMGAAGLSAN